MRAMPRRWRTTASLMLLVAAVALGLAGWRRWERHQAIRELEGQIANVEDMIRAKDAFPRGPGGLNDCVRPTMRELLVRLLAERRVRLNALLASW